MNYNRVRMYRCILGLALLALLIVYAISFENNNVQAMSFSVESGFYDEEFYLEINGTGTIYYTMDSSDPNKNSLVYTEPILIKDASDNENSYSMLTDVCPELNEELKDLGIVGDSGYSVPEHPVDKATVVKAVCIDKNGNCSDIITGVYFVGFGNKSGYDNIHIVSIVTDPDNLFGYENGIYVAGKNFDDNYVRLESLNDAWRRANYFKRGIDSGRLSTVSIWNADRTMVSNGTFILKIQGNASRAGLPKSLKISEISPLESQLNGTQLGFSSDIDSVILFGGAQDRYLKLRDYLVNNVCKELNITVRESVPCELFLDGEYWGTYYLYEPLDSLFFENHYGVIPGNVEYAEYVPATNTVEAGNSSDNSMYNSMYDFIAMNDMSIPENYLQAQELIDMAFRHF